MNEDHIKIRDMANLPRKFDVQQNALDKTKRLRELGYAGIVAEETDGNGSRATKWGRGGNAKKLDQIHGKDRPKLPICPYGCGNAGTLLEIVMGPDGRALGIFNDYPCVEGCIFVADLQLGEPPAKKKIVRGMDGQYHEVEA